MEDYTRIKIDRILANKFFESQYYKKNQGVSLTQLLNQLLELFLSGKIVNLNDENFSQVKMCADKLDKSCSEIVNIVLDRLEIVPVENLAKMKMNIYKENKLEIKRASNSITNW